MFISAGAAMKWYGGLQTTAIRPEDGGAHCRVEQRDSRIANTICSFLPKQTAIAGDVNPESLR
jgi:hypothetical protein